MRSKKLGGTAYSTPANPIGFRQPFIPEILEIRAQLLSVGLHHAVDPGNESWGQTWAKLESMRDAEIAAASKPLRDFGALQATQQFSNSQIFLFVHLVADITSGISVGEGCCLIDKLQENSRRNGRFLHGGKTPDVKIAKMMEFPFCVLLQTIGLKLLQESAKGTAGFAKDRKNRLVDNMLLMPSHEIASAISTPAQMATRPRNKLASAYREAMKNAPVLIDEKVSHSYVENVLYAPTKPMGTK